MLPPAVKADIGIVGAGGQSMFSLKEFLKLNDIQLITIAHPYNFCKNDILYDVGRGRGPTKKFIEDFYSGKTPNYKMSEYDDFRIMLAKERSLDAIVCATPDNNHDYVSILVMRAGKHVYCEKPLTHNVREGQKVRDVARESGLATQMGNQGHSLNEIRQTVEYLRTGAIGTVREAHSWVPASRWLPVLNGFPRDSDPVLQGFDWDLWLGLSAWRPYNNVYTPVKWRDFRAFGCGALGDFGCHDMDAATWAVNLQNPETVEVLSLKAGGKKIYRLLSI
jgi:predicted dehydrogenase